ncbi:O-methyltransferase [Flavobacteriales bacterium]|jgi:caffeoyl-CoA O-methyltransferase|nr:O-methyltransferase [Flavobacteriales bacterium]MBT4881158.1 O-methyltransferase [Flavobacteriales bacterium]MDC3306143.1 O-methyltransferase [Flavobacteriales bacterium]MDG1348384.1 O-methyltransferase [Flavobacteriales bacterium]
MEFLPEQIEEYAINHTEKEPQLLAELNRETWANVMIPRMLSGHLQGRVLSMFSKLVSPKNILEIGTYTGYSALCLAEGLKPSGNLHTLDINEEYTAVAKRYFNKSAYSNNIKQHIGQALDIIPNLDCKFQLAFIDADKENYANYFDAIIDKMDVGGLIIADNVLWSGKVTSNEMDEETQALDNYNKKIVTSDRVETVLFPVRDGLMISRKVK